MAEDNNHGATATSSTLATTMVKVVGTKFTVDHALIWYETAKLRETLLRINLYSVCFGNRSTFGLG